jgi:hypothetical protein
LREGKQQLKKKSLLHYQKDLSQTKLAMAVGKEIVVLSHMIEEVDFGSGPIYLVLENHVLGIVE